MTELGQVCEMALAVKQRAPKLPLQLLNRARERRLRDVALLGGTREVQLLCDCEKITNLMHFHGSTPQSRSALLDCQMCCAVRATDNMTAFGHTRSRPADQVAPLPHPQGLPAYRIPLLLGVCDIANASP